MVLNYQQNQCFLQTKKKKKKQNQCFPTNQSEPNTTHQRLDEKLYIETENVYKHVQIRVILGTQKRRER